MVFNGGFVIFNFFCICGDQGYFWFLMVVMIKKNLGFNECCDDRKYLYGRLVFYFLDFGFFIIRFYIVRIFYVLIQVDDFMINVG